MQVPINFRDFGGQVAGGGRSVVKGRLYRSGHFAPVAEADMTRSLNIDFAVVIDLRYADERLKNPVLWPADRLDRILAHDGATGTDAPHLAIIRASGDDIAAVHQAYLAFYQALPFNPLYRPLFAQALRAIAGTSGPILIHCTAGKDRTGTFVALLLALLGVADELIEADFMRSNDAETIAVLRREISKHSHFAVAPADPAVLDVLLSVRPAYIAGALSSMRQSCGSIDAYVAQAGIEQTVIEQLHDRLLSNPAPSN